MWHKMKHILLIVANEGFVLWFDNTHNRMHTPTIKKLYSASHSLVAPENVGLQKEQKYNTFACHTCNEVRLCVLEIHKKEVGNTKR
jgi:hypothetical protein